MKKRKKTGQPSGNSTSPRSSKTSQNYFNRGLKSTRQGTDSEEPRRGGYCAHLPRRLYELCQKDCLVVTEGEQAAGALVEKGIPAVGIPGFYPYVGTKNSRVLIPGLEETLARLDPHTVYFLTDAFGFAYQHSGLASAAQFLATGLSSRGIKVRLLQLGLNGPRTIAGLIRESGEGFARIWGEIVAQAREIDQVAGRHQLAAALVEEQIPNVACMSMERRSQLSKIAKSSFRQAKKGRPHKKALERLVEECAKKADARPSNKAARFSEENRIEVRHSVLALSEDFKQLLQRVGAVSEDPVIMVIRRKFEELDVDAIPTLRLLAAVPFSDGRRLAAYLAPFGIKPSGFSRDGRRFRGYHRKDFGAARSNAQAA